MASSLETALQKALSVRLNLQISLSQLPIIEEWMDIHLDRWLEHNPTPPDMPDGEGVSYLAMLGSDLRRVWWGAWGDPRGFVPRMADYFKLCNIAKSDAHLLDQIGEQLEPKLVGSWIGVWGGKVTTGWHFWDPHPWPKVESMFGTHEAKYPIKKWVEDHRRRADRAVHAVDRRLAVLARSSSRCRATTVDEQVAALSAAFAQFTGAPLEPAIARAAARRDASPQFGLSLRIRGGQIVRVGALAPGIALDAIEHLCQDAKVGVDREARQAGRRARRGHHARRVRTRGRARRRRRLLEPSEPAAKHPTPPPGEAN